MEPELQAIFGSKYLLEEKIGTGGMADVYRARLLGSEGFEKPVVLKKLQEEAATDPEITANFINEARLAALLQHENIVQVYDFGETQGSFYIAMEYLAGWDLATVLRKGTARGEHLPTPCSLYILSRICEAMDYAHSLQDLDGKSLNIIHRDLSPQNIFLTRDGKVKIIDFGIARAELSDNQTKIGLVKGKVSYMSPEQLSGTDIDRRSDLFTIGILMYEMLSGRRMYSGDMATLIRKCMEVDFVPFQEVCSGLEPSLYPIVEKVLSKDRELRYQSCGELQSVLEECLFRIAPRMGARHIQNYLLDTGLDKKSQPAPAGGNEKTVSTEVLDEHLTRILEYGGGTRPVGIFGKLFSVLVALLAVGLLFVLFLPGDSETETGTSAKTDGAAVHEVASKNTVDVQRGAEEKQVEVRLNPVQVISVPQKDPLTEKIHVLLEYAQSAMSTRRYTRPADDNAFLYYSKVIDLQPGNQEAREGLRQIAEKYSENAERALGNSDFSGAMEQIRRGLRVAPESGRLLSLRQRVEAQRVRTVRDLLTQAEKAMGQEHLTSPTGDCGYYYFTKVLILDTENVEATRGMQTIADRYAAKAEDSYRNFRLSEAKRFVKSGLLAVPNHRQLLELEKDLARSKPGILLRSLEKSFGDIVN